jgi:hypothetical protein
MATQAQLLPFDRLKAPPLSITASAQLCRQGQGAHPPQLLLRFALSTAEPLVVASPAARPRRCDGLWQATCLEAFVGDAAAEAYWEYNLSPSGDWNVYRLDGHRAGLRQEPYYSSLPFAISHHDHALSLELRCPLPPPLQHTAALELGLTAVLQEPSSRLSYWALNHPAEEPDFHDRRGWTLRL